MKAFGNGTLPNSIYRTVEDQAKDAEKMESTLRMPEIARMLGIDRNQVYNIVKSANLEIFRLEDTNV